MLTQDITRLFRKVEARLQQFGTGDATSEADEKARPSLAIARNCSRVASTLHTPLHTTAAHTTA